MAEEMSDRSLMLLLTVSFIVAVAGMFFAFKPTATGYAIFNLSNANQTAQANVTIVSNVQIQVTGGWDFGEGYQNSSGTGAYSDLQSGSTINTGPDDYNYTNWTANTNGSGQVTVTNIGNVNISVRANANQSPDRWFCADQNHNAGAGHLNNQSLNTTAGTAGGNCVDHFVPLTNFTQVNTTGGTLLCGLSGVAGQPGNLTLAESIVVDMAIRIDGRCPATTTKVFETITFFGYS